LLLAVAFLVGIWLSARLAQAEGIHSDTIWNIGLVVIASALIGAKLLLILVEFDYYRKNPAEIFSLETLRSGGVFLGGVIAALAATSYYFHRLKLPGWKLADIIAPGLALGHAIGRVGCFAAGCCFGKSCSLPWAVTFTSEYAHAYVGVPLNVSLHPTQLYEAAVEFVFFLGLLRFRKKKAFDGQVILIYLMSYSVVRFFLEFLRGDANGRVLGSLSTSQLIAVIGFPVCLFLYFRLRHIPQQSAAPTKPHRKK
jgi:phosphatidylglycerol:prolipoprotein diacylglycerol transferase